MFKIISLTWVSNKTPDQSNPSNFISSVRCFVSKTTAIAGVLTNPYAYCRIHAFGYFCNFLIGFCQILRTIELWWHYFQIVLKDKTAPLTFWNRCDYEKGQSFSKEGFIHETCITILNFAITWNYMFSFSFFLKCS